MTLLREYKWPLRLIIAGLVILFGTYSFAQAPASIRNSVAVCDPLYPQSCYSPGNSFANIATATTTLVKTGAGNLHLVSINTAAAGSVTLYDGLTAAGTKIAAINSATAGTTTYDVRFATGLTVVTVGSIDITVSYQ